MLVGIGWLGRTLGRTGTWEILVSGEAVTLRVTTPSRNGCCSSRVAFGLSLGDLQCSTVTILQLMVIHFQPINFPALSFTCISTHAFDNPASMLLGGLGCMQRSTCLVQEVED